MDEQQKQAAARHFGHLMNYAHARLKSQMGDFHGDSEKEFCQSLSDSTYEMSYAVAEEEYKRTGKMPENIERIDASDIKKFWQTADYKHLDKYSQQAQANLGGMVLGFANADAQHFCIDNVGITKKSFQDLYYEAIPLGYTEEETEFLKTASNPYLSCNDIAAGFDKLRKK